MQRAAHLPFQRLIDQLMLLHPRFAAKGFGDHRRGIVIAITGEVADRHIRIRDAALDQPLDLVCIHRHGSEIPQGVFPAMYWGNQPSKRCNRFAIRMGRSPGKINAFPAVLPSLCTGTPAFLARTSTAAASLSLTVTA